MAVSQILVLHTDGITASAAVLKKSGGAAQIVATTTAQSGDPITAISQILDGFKASGTRVPKTAIVASDRAILMRGDLPVNPERPRPYPQMRELVRWETELGFADLPTWDVETVLKASGTLTPEQDDAINSEITELTAQSLGGPPPRYQDIALSGGHITRVQRDAAVEISAALAAPVGDAGCGWIATSQDGRDNSGQYSWVLSGVSEGDRLAWRDACAQHKLKLLGIVPSWGLSAASEDESDAPEDASLQDQRLLIEKHSGAVALVHTAKDEMASIRILDVTKSRDLCADLRRLLDGRVDTPVIASGFDAPELDYIKSLFSQVTVHDALLPEIFKAAAAKGMGLKGQRDWPAVIAPKEPAPPFWKTPNFYRAMMVLIVLSSIGAVDLSTRLEKRKLDQRLVEMDKEYEEKLTLSNAVKKSVADTKQLKQSIQDATAEYEISRKHLDTAVYLQTRRNKIVQGLLKAVQNSIPPGVVMREIVESRSVKEVFTLSAWAIEDIKAEQFIANLNQNLSGLGLVVADEAVRREKGPNRLDGYSARLRITPNGYKLPEPTEEEVLQ